MPIAREINTIYRRYTTIHMILEWTFSSTPPPLPLGGGGGGGGNNSSNSERSTHPEDHTRQNTYTPEFKS